MLFYVVEPRLIRRTLSEHNGPVCAESTTKIMCKFTNRLFVFALLLLALGKILALPVLVKASRPGSSSSRNVVNDLLEFLYDDYNDNGFQQEDIYYDQRQKGAENLQLKMDGLVVAAAPAMTFQSLYLMAEQYFNMDEMLRQSTTEPDETQLYEKDLVREPESTAPENHSKISDPKTDLESRQQTGPQRPSRPSQLLEMLKKLKSRKN
ncbi:Hypothetical predicted protein [Drosophila guanche]|uniref:Uncharacterized protein n=1 Tax=Drosophila guanche TaxID=7266 RepID=A0A3B0K9L4_DROGU|nr:Hypothetical predicted protein [Drosophila guanche]